MGEAIFNKKLLKGPVDRLAGETSTFELEEG
jgi:hypothetical protein